MNILFVEDEAVMIESIRIGLENCGYRFFGTHRALQALHQLRQGGQRIDLIVTDYLMPGMNGIDFLKAVRKSHPTLPVIIMSANADKNLLIEAIKNRCDGFIEKPFSPEQLVSEIERLRNHIFPNTVSCKQQQLVPDLLRQVNDPLFTIGVSAELIMTEQIDGEAKLRQAKNIIKAVSRINHILEELLDAQPDAMDISGEEQNLIRNEAEGREQNMKRGISR